MNLPAILPEPTNATLGANPTVHRPNLISTRLSQEMESHYTVPMRIHDHALLLVRSVWAALCFVMLFSEQSQAQDLTHKAPTQNGPIALLGATLHPVVGPTIEHSIVMFENGVITNIGDARTVRLSSDVHTIDVSGQHIYPGLFAANTRLGLTEIGAVRAMRDYNEVGNIKPEVRACVSVNPDSTLIPVARTNGILTALTLPSGGLVPGQASVLNLDGWTWEDMTITPDAALVINWPRIDRPTNRWTGKPDDRPEGMPPLDDLTNLFDAARAYFALQATERTSDLRLESLRPYIQNAEHQRPILVNADTVDQITSALQWADANELRLVILGGRDAHLCAALLADHNVPVILQGTHGFPARTDASYDDAFTRPQQLHSAGVTWCLAPSDLDANIRNLPYEAATAVAYGLDHQIAIRSITLAPAQIFGLADRLGSIERGKDATLIVTDGPLLEIKTNLTHAFIQGRQIDLSNKQTKLRDKYEEKYRQLKIIGPE